MGIKVMIPYILIALIKVTAMYLFKEGLNCLWGLYLWLVFFRLFLYLIAMFSCLEEKEVR